MENKTVAVVMGYGIPPDIFEDGNYNTYLTEVLQRISMASIMKIIFCGGHTNPAFPIKTEAEEMARLTEELWPGHEREVVLVDNTTTAWQSLERVTTILCQNVLPQRAIIFCEKTRRASTWLIAQKCLPEKVEIVVIGIDFDVGRNVSKDVQQYLKVLWTFGECYLPTLRKVAKNWRKKLIKKTFRR